MTMLDMIRRWFDDPRVVAFRERARQFDARLGKIWNPIAESAIAKLATFIVAAISLVVLLQTAVSIQRENEVRKIEAEIRVEEKQARQEDREARAWGTLLRRVGGNTGKGDAINTLLKAGINLRDVDVSCKAAGGVMSEDPDVSGCSLSVLITGADLNNALLGEEPNPARDEGGRRWAQRIFGLDLSGTKLEGLRANNLWADFHLEQASIAYSNLQGTGFRGKIDGAMFARSNLSMTRWVPNEARIEIQYSDVSDAEFFVGSTLRDFRLRVWNSHASVDRPPLCIGDNRRCIEGVFRGVSLCGTYDEIKQVNMRGGQAVLPEEPELREAIERAATRQINRCEFEKRDPELDIEVQVYGVPFDLAIEWGLLGVREAE